MNKLLVPLVAAVALFFGFVIYQQVTQIEQPKHALYYQQARTIFPFSFSDHRGETFNQDNLTGQWSWVFFGYTSCPDVCPTTLQEINFVYPQLKSLADNTQVLLVTVDPKRDNVEKLNQYIGYFNDEFIALRAEHDVLFPFARNLGLMYAIADDSAQENYLVDHSASLVLINPQGKIAAIFKPEHELGRLPTISGDNLVKDFAAIIALSAS